MWIGKVRPEGTVLARNLRELTEAMAELEPGLAGFFGDHRGATWLDRVRVLRTWGDIDRIDLEEVAS